MAAPRSIGRQPIAGRLVLGGPKPPQGRTPRLQPAELCCVAVERPNGVSSRRGAALHGGRQVVAGGARGSRADLPAPPLSGRLQPFPTSSCGRPASLVHDVRLGLFSDPRANHGRSAPRLHRRGDARGLVAGTGQFETAPQRASLARSPRALERSAPAGPAVSVLAPGLRRSLHVRPLAR